MDPISTNGINDHQKNNTGNRRGVIRREKNLIIVVTPDEADGEMLSKQISHFGYATQVIRNWDQLENLVVKDKVLSILVDASLLPASSIADVVDDLDPIIRDSASLLFFSDRDDQSIRLKAVRAGGKAFFTSPINVVNLIDKLDSISKSEDEKPYRVMIIEDQPTVASYYEIVLKRENMTTRVVNNPMDTLNSVKEFLPDLILMDLYMPGIDGIELAQVIRQIDEYVSTPIVFLSSEEDFTKQIQARNFGGDDFLTKPIKAKHLSALVQSRLERLKTLRSFMVRDSLTGLYNHTSVRGRLAQEITRCDRQNCTLAVAMLDLDHFKEVNDTYGHPTGDTVLKSLARLLQQRLRNSDVVGRYGGEEFVSILLDANKEDANQVIDEIRQHFSKIQHYSSNQGVFNVTFSCGIATFPEFNTVHSLIAAADQALYRAKANGRNQVVLANRD